MSPGLNNIDQGDSRNAKSVIADQISFQEKCDSTLDIKDVQQLLVCKEEWSSSLDQEQPEPPHIKEEPEDLWTSQEAEQLPGLEDGDIIKFTVSPVPVKSEDEEEKQPSQLQENRETEPLASTSAGQMETHADGEDCGGSRDPAAGPEPSSEGQVLSSDCSGTETDDSEDWNESGRSASGFNTSYSQKTETADVLSVSDTFRTSGELSNIAMSLNKARPSFPTHLDCKVCGKPFPKSNSMMLHASHHPQDCGLCGKRLEQGESLRRHYEVHTTCDVCGKQCSCLGLLDVHMRLHAKQKPFSCPFCRKGFVLPSSLNTHMKRHVGGQTFDSL